MPSNPSLQPGKAAPAAGQNSTAPPRDGKVSQSCVVCGAPIVDEHWFCRLPGDEGPLLLCCPSCALRYLDRPHEANGRNGDSGSRRTA
jgi:hypothetical protein